MTNGRFYQSCPYFFTREGATLSLVGLHRGASAFLIGGGPSFAEIDKSKLHGVWTMTLNNAVASYRSCANCTLGDASQFNYSTWLDPLIQKFAPFSAFEKPLWDNRLLYVVGKMEQQWRRADLVVGDCPNVIGYRRNEKFEPRSFLHEETINCGARSHLSGVRSVMLPALRILFLLGFRKVYLLGVDFEMKPEQPYHFPETFAPATIKAKMEAYALMQQWLAELQPLFLAEKFVIKNCNPNSKLTAFPFISFKEAIEEATALIGDHSKERTIGMYKELAVKEAESECSLTGVPSKQSGSVMKGSDAEEESVNLGGSQTSRISVVDGDVKARKLLLRNFQSPGDIVMLTAALRDLHKCYPGRYETDVRTPCPQLWENNPYITPMNEKDPAVEVVECQYPLIHRSNLGPWHFIQGFSEFLNERLKIQIKPTGFKGDIHLTPAERKRSSQVQEITRKPVPFWIITAGGKLDYTIKWWAHERFQSVIDHFRGKILFIQVGEKGHNHPALNGVLDLRGKTDLRELVLLVHHSQGILCPVTLLMHLAAAVEIRAGMPKNRACVVVAGGREPPQWEAYPHHQFIHTNGALPCCDNGGCWKSRTTPVGDGDKKDDPQNLCVDVVMARDGNSGEESADGSKTPKDHKRTNALSYSKEQWPSLLPRCMDMIKPDEVIQRIEVYFKGEAIKYLSSEECSACNRTIPTLGWS